MAQTTPPSITSAPVPVPQRNDRTTFSTRVDAFVTWMINAVTEFSNVAINVYNNAVDTYNNSVIASTQATTATTQANLATTNGATQVALATIQANNAATSAITAINAPGTSATSVTSATIGSGSKSLTIQTGKNLIVGMWIIVADTSSPSTNQMLGSITSYNSGTGALIFTVPANGVMGSGTLTAWTISLSTQPITLPRISTGSFFFGNI